MRRLKIALDCRAGEARTSGIGRYAINLARGLAASSELDLILLVGADVHPALAGITGAEVVQTTWSAEHKSFVPRARWEASHLRPLLKRLAPQIYHATWNYGIPLFAPCRTVLTVHDLLPLVLANEFGSRQAWCSFIWSQYSSLFLADAVIAVSDSTRAAVGRFARFAASKTRVILEGVEDEFNRKPDREAAEYVLYVGALGERKNVPHIFRAYREAVEAGVDWPLKIAGRFSSLTGTGLIAYQELPDSIREKVEFLGFVPDQDLPDLYRRAAVFMFPSLAEGFGFPPLEAMACGAPVITTRSGSIPEITADAVIYVDPAKPEETARAIALLAKDPALRGRFIEAGLRRAELLRWPACITGTLAVYRSCLSSG